MSNRTYATLPTAMGTVERERERSKSLTMDGINVVGVKKKPPDCKAFMMAAEKATYQRRCGSSIGDEDASFPPRAMAGKLPVAGCGARTEDVVGKRCDSMRLLGKQGGRRITGVEVSCAHNKRAVRNAKTFQAHPPMSRRTYAPIHEQMSHAVGIPFFHCANCAALL